MTTLAKPVRRVTRDTLDGSHGPDRGKRIVVTLLPGDVIELRPERTRRGETISLADVYAYALRSRVHGEQARLEKRIRELVKAGWTRREARRQARKEAQ
mgnify:CR=1 FL=1